MPQICLKLRLHTVSTLYPKHADLNTFLKTFDYLHNCSKTSGSSTSAVRNLEPRLSAAIQNIRNVPAFELVQFSHQVIRQSVVGSNIL